MIIMGGMAAEQPPPAREPSNVIQLETALRRKRVNQAIAAALKLHAPITTIAVTEQLVALDINVSQILHGMKRAEFVEFSEDPANGRLSFTAKLLSAGEEFFVAAAVEPVVPFPGVFVVIRKVWR
jgi:hypothetical protein